MPTKIEHLSDDTRDELAQMALALSGNKDTRKDFLGLVKKAAPDTPIPEIDEPARVEAVIAEERKAREKFEQEQRDRWLQQDLGARKQAVMGRYGLDEAQMKSMEERMGKKELPADYEWAARIFTQETEPAAPSNYGQAGHGMYEMPAAEGLMENEQHWSVKTAHQIIDEIQKKNSRSAF